MQNTTGSAQSSVPTGSAQSANAASSGTVQTVQKEGVELQVWGKPFFIARDEFECLSDYLYYKLWCAEICWHNAKPDEEEEGAVQYIQGCQAHEERDGQGFVIVRFRWTQQRPKAFTAGKIVIISRTDPLVDGWKTMPIHTVSHRELTILQPKQVPYDLREGEWRLDIISDVKQRHRCLNALKMFSLPGSASDVLRELIMRNDTVAVGARMSFLNSRQVSEAEEKHSTVL